MAVTGINNYREALFQWQGQQLKSSASTAKSTQAGNLTNLFEGSSMSGQLSSMIELTKYAMDAMGLASDSRVTFSQISKYRGQLQEEFSQSLKDAIANAGIKDKNALSFTLDEQGKLSVSGSNNQDCKLAQAWLDANPGLAKEIVTELNKNGLELKSSLSFQLASNDKLILLNQSAQSLQDKLDQNQDLSQKISSGLQGLGLELGTPLDLEMDETGNLVVNGDNPDAEGINAWLAQNTEFAESVKKNLDSLKIHPSALKLRLGSSGTLQATLKDSDLDEMQKALSGLNALGKKMNTAFDSLGIDPQISFSIQIDADGSVKVQSEHPDRDKIQRLFDDDPALVKKFRMIETLSGIDDARKAMQISPSEMRKRLQVESMVSWWAGSGNASTYFGNYSDGGLSVMSGLNLSV